MTAPSTAWEAEASGWGDDWFGSAEQDSEREAAEHMAAENGRPLSSAVVEISMAAAAETARPVTEAR